MNTKLETTQQTDNSSFAVTLVVSLVSSLIMLDSNIVAVSLPAIGKSLDATFTDIQWVIGAYMLTYAALLLASGSYADLVGRRKAMSIGLIIFGLSSVACGVANSILFLNLARAAQGVGGALLLTASVAIISHRFSGADRLKAFAVWGASIGIALAIGPIVGGAITNYFGWRWIFLFNLPVSAILLGAAFKYVSESRDPDAKRLDWFGIVTFSLALSSLIWAMIDGSNLGWGSAKIIGRMATAGVLFAAFVVVELRHDRPMVDLRLFKKKTLSGSVVAMIGYGASAQIMVFMLPLYLQNALGFAPFAAGLAMAPFALPMVVAPRITTILAARYSGRALLTGGLALTVVADLLFSITAREAAPYYVFAICMFVSGCGAGILNGQTVKAVQSAVPENRAGMASGLASTTRFVGILISVAGLGAILSDVTRSVFIKGATLVGLPYSFAVEASKQVTAGAVTEVLQAVQPSLRMQVRTVAFHAYGSGFSSACWCAMVVACISTLLTYVLVQGSDTSPVQPAPRTKMPCKFIDCRSPI